MPDLIPIVISRIGTSDIESVDGRVLHANLGLESHYALWIRTWIHKANLVEHRDYEVFNSEVVNPKGGRPTLEYALSVDAAKCLAMMSGGRRGDEVRAYFLAREQQAIALERHVATAQVKNPANQMLIEAIVRLDAVEQQAQEAKTEALQATANAHRALETQAFLTIAEYVYINNLQAQVPESAYKPCSDHLRLYCMEHNIPFRKIVVGGKRWEDEYGFHHSAYAEAFPGWLKRRFAQGTLRAVHAQQHQERKTNGHK